ncbi:SPOR domain-containing protein [Paraglaciecola arctica]|uniref:SPOR domain-containing protein n=1 Tax=Paraglaciecola arctica TaxID=1128911 RepID=UPI001C068C6A|nr:SPOR domain-containing protein [Paraglaciecola arctica]MBU3006156.1 SPOR domain-containing protein [Paraglaciecola arctica]
MAHKDYVARGRGKKTAPPPPKPSLPWLRIIITLVLVAGFAYFLWSIKGTAPDDTTTKVVTPEQNTKQENALPEIPEEEWEFIKTLPEYTVEIDHKEQDQPTVRRLIQCGSFRTDGQAQELKAKIAFQGLEAQVRPSQGSSGKWYRVILGPYDSKRGAEKDRHTLQRAKINGCKIWNWNL